MSQTGKLWGDSLLCSVTRYTVKIASVTGLTPLRCVPVNTEAASISGAPAVAYRP